MKATELPSSRKDFVATSIVLLCVAGELGLREQYYRLWSELPRMVLVVGLWLLVLLCWRMAVRWRGGRYLGRVSRMGVVVSLALWLDLVAGVVFAPLVGRAAQTGMLQAAAILLWAVAAWFSLRWSATTWARVRRASCATAFLFVASQPVVAALNAPAISWPNAAPGDQAAASSRAVTVFLLLDELNANAAGTLVDALAKAGRGVKFKTLVPAGDATAQVVPAMLAGRPFRDAKPCGLATVCSGMAALDFKRIVASRPDVDVVGFYEPYCAMRGLRSCARLSPASPASELNRWWCAALRRSDWLSERMGRGADRSCGDLNGVVWSHLASDVEAAIERAPVWREGGFLFAHVPLPHPPGEGGDGSLPSHYRNNLARAVHLIDRMVATLSQEPDRQVTIVVFSDHPLRAGVWCATTQYRHNGCPLPQELQDDRVPLIVAGDVPAAFDALTSNMEVFRLARP